MSSKDLITTTHNPLALVPKSPYSALLDRWPFSWLLFLPRLSQNQSPCCPENIKSSEHPAVLREPREVSLERLQVDHGTRALATS